MLFYDIMSVKCSILALALALAVALAVAVALALAVAVAVVSVNLFLCTSLLHFIFDVLNTF